jgi:hypothetical protein
MKIYPSKHRVKQVAESNIDRDISIALAYLNRENVEYKIDRTVSKDFSFTTKTALIPNQEIDNEDVLIFDDYGNPMDSSTVINRIEDKYYYYPNNMIEFDPLQFTYEVIAKKRMNYNINSKFNMNIHCIDDPENLNFLNRLSKILVAPSEKNFLPNNIAINNNKTDANAMLHIDDNTDFIFVESKDGKSYNFLVEDTYDDISSLVKMDIPYTSFLESHQNIWVVSDEHYLYPITKAGQDIKVSLTSPKITSERSMYIKDYYNASDPSLSTLKVHNLFENDICPILILEYIDRGFVIISSSEIFTEENIDKYKHIIYEVLMYVYCNTYKRSRTINEYITYNIPDYEVISGQLYPKTGFVSGYNLNDILKLSSNSYTICSINILDNNPNLAVPNEDLISTVEDIEFKGVSNNRAVFSLNNRNAATNIYQEPNKPTGWKSIYYNKKIYYVEQIAYLMETDIGKDQYQLNKLFLIEKDFDLSVRLYPFKSSKHGLNITKDLRLTIPFIKTTVNGIERIRNESYVLYIDTDNNMLQYLFKEDFEQAENRIELATINVSEVKSDQYLTDMRLKGGGLPEDMPDNFNLLDIGHIYGRPYRQANTLIITLPKKYEQYKDEILKVINKYKVAEDYPILFFEDDEMDGEI